MDPLHRRFLEAFDEIHRYLRRLLNQRPGQSFYDSLSNAAKQHAFINSYWRDLMDFADLRNYFSHNNDRLLAIPSAKTVERIEEIKSRLIAPPKLFGKFAGKVDICSPQTRISLVAAKMREGDFSQVPVYSDDQFIKLFTSETIARWFAHTIAVNQGMLEDGIVADALPFTEPTTTCEFVGRDATVFDALDLFDVHLGKGHSLDAILLTNSGQKKEKPLGIITIYDVPRLRSME